jgi:hemolysin-activating ACP:hemolysin acyltransferase
VTEGQESQAVPGEPDGPDEAGAAGSESRPAVPADLARAVARTAFETTLGSVVRLMMADPASRALTVAELEQIVLPPRLLNQYRLFRDAGSVVGFAAWGLLSVAAEARPAPLGRGLQPGDWRSDDRAWVILLLVPAGREVWCQQGLVATVFGARPFRVCATQRT